MTEKEICKYCKEYEQNEAYCRMLGEIKSSKNSCNEFKMSKFANIL